MTLLAFAVPAAAAQQEPVSTAAGETAGGTAAGETAGGTAGGSPGKAPGETAGETAGGAAVRAATGKLRLCANRSVDGGPFTTGHTSTEQPLPPGHVAYAAVYDAGVSPGEFAGEVHRGLTGVPAAARLAEGLEDAGGLLDPASARLHNGELHRIDGGSCTDVAVAPGRTYYVVPYGKDYDAEGRFLGYRDFSRFGAGPGWTHGYWIGGGYPAGSHFDGSGLFVTPAGDRAFFSGGTGGHLGGRVMPITVEPGGTRRISTIVRHFSVTITKKSAPGGRVPVANRTFLLTDRGLGSHPGKAGRSSGKSSGEGSGGDCCTAVHARTTGSDGTLYTTDPLAGRRLTAYEYIGPAEWAGGLRADHTAQGVRPQDVAYHPVTTALKESLLSEPYLEEYDRDLLSRIETGGFFAGGGPVLDDVDGGPYRARPVVFTGSRSPAPAMTAAVTVTGTDTATGAPLAGAAFELWRETNGRTGLQTGGADPDTGIGSPCTTGPDGVCSLTVTQGTYYWRQSAAPVGYDLPADPVLPLTLTASGGGRGAAVTARSARTPVPPVSGRVTVVQADAESGARLAGAVFELWRETNGRAGLQSGGAAPDERTGPDCVTDRTGRCTRTVGTGRYYWRQTAAPAGYALPAVRDLPLTLTDEGASTGGNAGASNGGNAGAATGAGVTALSTRIPPAPVSGEVRVVMKDAESGATLAGAEFELWRETNGRLGLQTTGGAPDTGGPDTRVGAGCVTGADGRCARTVTAGTYYWYGTGAPAGYTLPGDRVAGPLPLFAVNASQGVTGTAESTRTEGAVMVRTVDGASGRTLTGAEFRLWRETNGRAGLRTAPSDGIRSDTLVRRGCSMDSAGYCVFDELGAGTYWLQETRAPKGYVLPGNPVTGPYVITAADADEPVTVKIANKRGEPGRA
ncbi:collagen binding domain-containing protein [Streptomyces sp. NPDC051018]|uniref:collagen binding domain-containing protein n=1 Tax=Streptomyces sp. NPDC051018 TaxID=3365639 RepID=UPI0037A63C9F